MDVNTLIEENMGRLTLAARKLSRNLGVPDMMENLIQEGSIALMEAAERYDTSGDASFDVYSDRIIKSAMLDYIYRNATPFTIPPDRFRVLRRVARLLADGGGVQEICGDLSVSPAVARKLILEYHETLAPARRRRHTSARQPNCVGSSTPESTAAGGRRSKLFTEQMRRHTILPAISHGQKSTICLNSSPPMSPYCNRSIPFYPNTERLASPRVHISALILPSPPG